MRRIAIEEHFFTEGYLDYLRSRISPPRLETFIDPQENRVERMWRSTQNFTVQMPQRLKKLTDIGAGRVADMDKAGIDVQVLSIASPGVDELEIPEGTAIAVNLNNELAQAVNRYPKRLAGFASIAPGNPIAAAQELERAVKELGLKGAKINSHGRGEYLDEQKYLVFWKKAEELGVPIYIHPKEPPEYMLKPYAKYPVMATAMWGFGADTGLHAMLLICSGLFDVCPKLKIILGHLGEAIPFWLWRIDNIASKSITRNNFKRKPSDYFKENFYVTTSGMMWEPAMLFTNQVLGSERIMFAVDYPYEDSNQAAVKFMDELPLSNADKENIYSLNAEKLMGL
jgi:5-carboxyvanillate decarboxylase